MLTPEIQFSLFEGDLVNRVFSRLHLNGRRARGVLGRILVLILLTYVPMALLAWYEGLSFGHPAPENFFYDIAAYAQFLIGLPLFVLAESLIAVHTREAAKRFNHSGIISQSDAETLASFNRKLAIWRKDPRPEAFSIMLALVLSLITLTPLLSDDKFTWHAQGPLTHQSFSATAVWAICVALPVLNYCWIRWIWKIALWTTYLYQVSRCQLLLVASHPDRTGGIGFLSEVQSKFGLLILAYGVSNVLATVSYELIIQKMTFEVMTVWGPIVSFIISAPLIFTIPLFLFTKQLYRTKKRAIEIYQDRAMERARALERHWLKACEQGDLDSMAGGELAGLNNLTSVFERIHHMRVVPFDLRSFAELVGAAIGPILPLLPYLHIIPEPILKALEESLKLLHH